MLKRVGLFLITNLAILIVISVIFRLFGIEPYLSSHGINYQSLLIFSAVIGFVGSAISLFISKWMAIHAYNVKIINQPSTEQERWLVNQVKRMATQQGVGMPEVGIYDSPEPNAFATGWNKNNALVAVSTGLLDVMDSEEVEGVLGHEVAHVANGDMVTLALIQGVVNTFVIFFARIAAYFVAQFLSRGEDSNAVGGFAYYGTAIVFEILFGILASLIVMWFSRYREFRADAGSAKIVGKEKMIKALRKLEIMMDKTPEDDRAPAMNTMKISTRKGWMELFSSHPPIEKRITALLRESR